MKSEGGKIRKNNESQKVKKENMAFKQEDIKCEQPIYIDLLVTTITICTNKIVKEHHLFIVICVLKECLQC